MDFPLVLVLRLNFYKVGLRLHYGELESNALDRA